MESIKYMHLKLAENLIKDSSLDGILICNCSIGNLRNWCLGSSDMPIHMPFGRNNLIFIDSSGAMSEYCARQPHPCDWNQFPVITETGLPESFKGLRLGIVNMTYLKKSNRDWLVSAYPGIELIDIGYDFHRLKVCKTDEEITKLKAGATIFDRVFTAVPMLLMNEPTEREFAVMIRNCFRDHGAECEDLAGSTVISLTSAPMSAISVKAPVTYPGRRMEYGDRINLTVNGYVPGGYASCLGRTFVIGQPDEQTIRDYDIALNAQRVIAEHARPGVTVDELMKLLNDNYIKPNGLAASECSQIYGIGAYINEFPRNTDSSGSMPLAEGMTIVISPYVCREGCDPYACADVFVITKDGAKRLGAAPSDLVIIE